MDSNFWLDAWNEGNIGFHQSSVSKHLVKYIDILQSNDQNVLVPLCGKSLDMNFLIENEYQVYGVEIVEKAINDYFHENKITPKIQDIGPYKSENQKIKFCRYQSKSLNLYHGNFHQFDQCGLKFNAVYDRASMIALPPKMRELHANTLTKLLLPGGNILLITLEYDQSKVKGPPHSVDKPEIELLFGSDFNINVLSTEKTKNIGAKFKDNEISYVIQRVYCLTKK